MHDPRVSRCRHLAVVAVVLGAAVAAADARAPAAPTAPIPEAAGTIEATSLLGKPLHRPAVPAEDLAKLEGNLEAAAAAFAEKPDDPEATIWLGRRLAYLGRYRDAIAVYTQGLEKWPQAHTLYRHRGHRYITVRNFAAAVADLEKAAALIAGVPDAIEPDGAPNARNVPRSTSHSNIWYHLGLAYYLQGDFTNALRCYRECLKFCTNDDMLCATTDWLYMTLRRLGRNDDAHAALTPIRREMEIFESFSYHKRLLLYKGELQPEALLDTATAAPLDVATQGYGVGNWHLYSGDHERARSIFERVIAGTSWAAFGYIAAEAELARGIASEEP
jgi:tetratricopeptide (TPR) repeat protein